MNLPGAKNSFSRARVVAALLTHYTRGRLQDVSTCWHPQRRAYTVSYIKRGKLYLVVLSPRAARALVRKGKA